MLDCISYFFGVLFMVGGILGNNPFVILWRIIASLWSLLERGLHKDEKNGASSSAVLSLVFEGGRVAEMMRDDKAYIIVSPRNMWW